MSLEGEKGYPQETVSQLEGIISKGLPNEKT